MNIKKIYETRFVNVEQRKLIWQVLVSDFFQQFIKKNDVVLDVACGYGEFINNIVCGEKFAVDLNKSVRRYLNKDVKFFSESSIKMPSIKDGSIDKIFVSNFFEHLEREDIIKTIVEFKKKLKKRGEVLILQPNIRFCAKDYWMFFDHLTPIDDRAMEEIFLTYRLQLKKRILRFLPYTTKSNLPKSSVFVKIYLKLPFLWSLFGKQSFLVFEKL